MINKLNFFAGLEEEENDATIDPKGELNRDKILNFKNNHFPKDFVSL